MNIYLVGFMGTGKTSVGRGVARSIKWQFVDLDELIEAREKRTIPDIFAQSGEPYFREVEKQVLKQTAEKDNLVAACGGGIVIDPENIRLMKQTGKIICLKASPEAILNRTKKSSHRPLLNVDNPMQRIEELLEKRAAFYALADITIDTSALSVKQVEDEVIKIMI
ncbi:MAG: shikimate kinase [Candidatus Omnitrophota bacterium]